MGREVGRYVVVSPLLTGLHRGYVRRVFGDLQGISQQLKSVQAMGLQRERSPDAMNAGAAQSARFRKGTCRPARGVAWRRRLRGHALPAPPLSHRGGDRRRRPAIK